MTSQRVHLTDDDVTVADPVSLNARFLYAFSSDSTTRAPLESPPPPFWKELLLDQVQILGAHDASVYRVKVTG